MELQKAFLTAAFVTALLVPAVAQQAAPQQPATRPPPPPLTVKLIRDGVYWAQGGVGGNSGIIVGKDGVTVIDAKQTADTAKEMLADIAKITDKPLKQVILTGSGGEGIPGLAAFPDGLQIITHADTAKTLQARFDKHDNHSPPKMANVILKKDQQLLTLNGVRMVFLHIAPSHTDGESSVYLPDQRIVFTGFVVQSRPDYPIIHPDGGGSARGWIKFMKTLIHLDADTYVLGMGDIWTKADMEKRLSDQEAVLAKIQQMVAAGKSREEMRQALGTDKINPRGPQIYFFSEVAYDETVKGMK